MTYTGRGTFQNGIAILVDGRHVQIQTADLTPAFLYRLKGYGPGEEFCVATYDKAYRQQVEDCFDIVPPPIIAPGGPVSVPYHDEDGLPVITVQTSHGPVDVLVDTGAEYSIFDSVAAKSAGKGTRVEIRGAAGAEPGMMQKMSIAVGGRTIEATVIVGTLNDGVHALIGEDMLEHFRSVSIDYVHKVVIFE